MRRWQLLMALGLVAAGQGLAAQQYSVTGLVLKVDRSHLAITLSCQSIPGFMNAMVMPLFVREAKSLDPLAPGMLVDFTLVVRKTSSYAENIRPRNFENLEQPGLEARRLKLLEELDGSSQTNVLAIGRRVPSFRLIDQNRRRITLAQFAGKVVAVNFIYTHCPLPDYCFRLSNNFGVLQERFKSRMGQDLVLLSVTFDPVHDQPEVLADYARTWKADPNHWHFLTGPEPDVRRVSKMFGVDFWPDEAELMHSLHTVILDRRGKLAANLEGNQFTAQQLGDLVETVMNHSK